MIDSQRRKEAGLYFDLEIEEAFRLAQKAHNNKAKLVASLKNRYNKLEDKTEFHEEFICCLKYAMIIYTREPAVENVIDFVTKFAASFETPVNEDAEEVEEEDENEFLNFLLNFLLESHGANRHAGRFRVCQLVNKLLGSLSENAQIDGDLCDRIHKAMLIRTTDKYPNVRIQAALAMARLQDTSNSDCPTIKAYVLLLENDSNPEVRRAVLSCIAPSVTTLPKIYKRTRDVKEKVRKLAYQVLAENVHIRVLSIAQRVSLLHEGLSDSAVYSVKEVVKTHLLPAWLRLLQGDVLQLLHRLDVENCAETAVTTLHAIFSMATSPDDLLQNGVRLDERKLIPVDSLTCENVLYWRALCEFVKSKGNEGEELLEQLLPEAAIFAEYLYSYLRSITQLSEEQKADMTQLEMAMNQEFVGQQLIMLVGCLDSSEEGGRKRTVAVLKEILVMPNTPTSLIGLLVEKLIGLLRDETQKIQMVAEIISDVREPILPISKPVDENEKCRKQVRVNNEAKQTLEECISCQDFSRAAELKDTISQLEELKNQLTLEASQPADNIKEQRVEKSDPETLLKCLTMCAELFKKINIKRGICPTTNALIESLILPSVSNPNPAVRNMAVICLGTAALHSKDLANTHLVLLLQITQLDEPKIRISALRVFIDQLLLNGLNILQDKSAPISQAPDSPDNSNGQPEQQTEEESTVQSILKMLSEFLDSEICELRTETAEGLAKLMYCGRILSPKLLSRLALLWYNPVTEDDQRLRHCLGVFLQLYARASRTNQECVEESFLPTMRTLFNAPVTSPLSEVDTSNVAELFVELTRPSALVQPAAVQVHLNIHVRLYCKTLSWLEINTEPGPANSELQLLLKDILQEVKDKYCTRVIEKLCNQLNGDRCSKSGGNQDTTLLTLDENTGGQKKASTAKNGKKARKAELSSDEGDEENVPEAPPSVRPSRRAKIAALDKLTALINQEANGS
uniref:Non-SMC condensin I complex, subunit G n=1 Tax=Sinocyclocheilus anshuiensis TaxID=1608454 RepID=A0A671KYF3_9TELE